MLVLWEHSWCKLLFWIGDFRIVRANNQEIQTLGTSALPFRFQFEIITYGLKAFWSPLYRHCFHKIVLFFNAVLNGFDQLEEAGKSEMS